jgi:hypothetical protein
LMFYILPWNSIRRAMAVFSQSQYHAEMSPNKSLSFCEILFQN